MNKPRLSIIVPVYQVPDTLSKCVESIVAQTFQDWELLLIDDGSADECGTRCDEWSMKDARITTIHQTNQGLSAARNTGISKAQGEYITFIDSDDWIDTDTLRPVMLRMDAHANCDLMEYEAIIHEGCPRQYYLQLENRTYLDWKLYWLEQKAYSHTYACNKVFKTSLFTEVHFPVGQVFEDASTLPKLIQHCRCIMTVNHGCYHYLWNEHGITVSASAIQMQTLVKAHLQTARLMDIQAEGFTDYLAQIINCQLTVYAGGGKICHPSIFKEMQRCPMHSTDINGKEKLKVIIFKLIGITWLCKIYKSINRTTKY